MLISGVYIAFVKVKAPLMKERWRAYVEGGKVLLEKFGGRFSNCLKYAVHLKCSVVFL